MTHIISDTHFNHGNIIRSCHRPFKSIEHQNEVLINNWNAVVDEHDIVIHCGDFIMGAAKDVPAILDQLSGNIILTRGNHDTDAKLAIYEAHPRITLKDIHYLPYKGLYFIFCHFPMPEELGQMVFKHNSECVWVHGHVHGETPFANLETNSFNVSVEAIKYAPCRLETIYQQVRNSYKAKGVWVGK